MKIGNVLRLEEKEKLITLSKEEKQKEEEEIRKQEEIKKLHKTINCI